jgi:outer membrane protein assembly factor BamB
MTDHPIRSQVGRTTTIVAGVFSVVFLVLLAGNFIGMHVKGPRQEDRLAGLIASMRHDPTNTALQSEIRQLDLAIRQARIWRLNFAHHCGEALLFSIVVLLIAGKLAVGPTLPGVGKRTIEGAAVRQIREALVARRAVVAAVVVAVGAGWGLFEAYGPLTFAAAEVRAPVFASMAEKVVQWPRFRGPGGSGVTALDNIPTKWNGASGDGILWKVPVPLPGNNSPVVWDKRVFLAGGSAEKREVYCFDADSGQLQWTGDVPISPAMAGKKIDMSDDTGFAPSTLATDGHRVYAIFPTGDVAAFDFTGRRLWVKSLGLPESSYGYASSLDTYQDRVIVQFDHGEAEGGKSRLYALDGSTGRIVWETKRDVGGSWTSPIVVEVGGKPEIVTVANPWVVAYDPAGGAEIWRAKCVGGDTAPSPIYAGGLIVAIEPYSHMAAVKADGKGDVTATHVAWKFTEGGSDICSPVGNDQFVYMLESSGTLTCCTIADGKKAYSEDLKEVFMASPSLVGNKLYLLAESGVMRIAEVGPAYKEIGKCELGEKTRASPAFAGGRLYLRGASNLYCIGGRP